MFTFLNVIKIKHLLYLIRGTIMLKVSFHFASESVSKEEMLQSLVKRGFMAEDPEEGSPRAESSSDQLPR